MYIEKEGKQDMVVVWKEFIGKAFGCMEYHCYDIHIELQNEICLRKGAYLHFKFI